MVKTRSQAVGKKSTDQKMKATCGVPTGVKKRSVAKSVVDKSKKALKKSNSIQKPENSVKNGDANVANTDTVRKFTNPMVIGDEDFLSRLSSDCLDVIFTRLNQDDLDKVSEVSQLMKAAADYVRHRAFKSQALFFSLSQNADSQTRYEVAIGLPSPDTDGLRAYAMDTSKSDSLPDKFDQDIGFQRIEYIHEPKNYKESHINIGPVKQEILDHILPRVERFEFERYQFTGIEINAKFLEDFKHIGGRHLKLIRFYKCAFDKNLSLEGRKRFLSVLLAARPTELFLIFPRLEDITIFDEDFIRRFAAAVAHPKLTIRNVSRPANRDFLSVLTRFDVLRMRFQVLKPEQLLDMILDRLEMGAGKAQWMLELDGQITDEILTRIDETKFHLRGRTAIVKNGTNFSARLTYISHPFTRRILAEVAIDDEYENEWL